VNNDGLDVEDGGKDGLEGGSGSSEGKIAAATATAA
jgi:hypothetical protein